MESKLFVTTTNGVTNIVIKTINDNIECCSNFSINDYHTIVALIEKLNQAKNEITEYQAALTMEKNLNG